MRFAVAVLAAGLVQVVPYLQAAVPAGPAIAYLCFAALGAGFFAGRRAWLAGGLSVIVGAAVAGIVSELRAIGASSLVDFITAETGLVLVIVPYAFLGALAGALGGWLRSRAIGS